MFEKRKQRKEELRKQQEAQAKMQVKQTLNKMKLQSSKLEEFKRSYIDKAKNAALTNSKEMYDLAKSGLKICLTKQRFIDSMIANFELSLQITDMNKVVGEFVDGMNIIASQLGPVSNSIDMSKAQSAYETALANNETQYEALSAFLTSANQSIESLDGFDSQISDEEIDKLISSQATDEIEDIDRNIEEKISSLKEKIGENY